MHCQPVAVHVVGGLRATDSCDTIRIARDRGKRRIGFGGLQEQKTMPKTTDSEPGDFFLEDTKSWADQPKKSLSLEGSFFIKRIKKKQGCWLTWR